MFTKLWFLYDKAKAIEYYEKFLELWKDAGPGITGFEDTKTIEPAGSQKP